MIQTGEVRQEPLIRDRQRERAGAQARLGRRETHVGISHNFLLFFLGCLQNIKHTRLTIHGSGFSARADEFMSFFAYNSYFEMNADSKTNL
jgi:hypothetical protein